MIDSEKLNNELLERLHAVKGIILKTDTFNKANSYEYLREIDSISGIAYRKYHDNDLEFYRYMVDMINSTRMLLLEKVIMNLN